MSPLRLGRYSPAARRAIGLDLAACAVALALVLLVSVNLSAAARLVLTLLFTFFVPGRAIVSNWPRMARWSGVGMSIVFSLGTLTLLATLTLWIRLWNPLALFMAVAVVSLSGLIIGIARRQRNETADDEG